MVSLAGTDPHREEERPMATIRASCPTCKDVELTTADVRVRVCIDDDRGEYSFRCPRCRMVVVKGAESRTIDLLIASGVTFDTWSLPAELDEIRTGAPISHDDLLDFHLLLNDDRSLAAALETIQSA
jgi:phage FluMu protein Com